MKRALSDPNILSEIRNVLNLEAAALRQVAKSIDAAYARATRLILKCKGKIVVTGIGKSGIIAQKIAATLASTGTPALFMHPTEGLHGDLGLLESRDLVLAVGKSGESSELSEIVVSLKRMKVKLISITASPRSTLAKNSTICLHTPIKTEACPLNLAPTASTTAALAVGDALAVSLMHLRGFNREHFAKLHPAGQLGKRLTLKVSDVMRGGTDNPTVSIRADAPAMLVEITKKQSGAVNVVDGRGRLVGLVTDFDIRQALEEGSDVRKMPLRRIMNPEPIRIRADKLAVEAIELMENRERPFSVLPVVDAKNRSVGIVQIHDLRARGL